MAVVERAGAPALGKRVGGRSAEAAAYLAEIDRQRARLYRMLRRAEWVALNRRPSAGKWSALENARHLLFAEELHLGRFVEGGVEFSGLGMMHATTSKKFAAVGTKKPRSLVELLDAWDALHRRVRAGVRKSDAVELRALWRNARHLRIHTDIVERVLRS